MIKVKTFTMNSCNVLHHERLDKVINKWLEENDVEIILYLLLCKFFRWWKLDTFCFTHL